MDRNTHRNMVEKMVKKTIAALTLLTLSCILSSCYSVTLRPEGEAKLISEPTAETSYDFFFWGLAKKYNIDGKALCSGGVRQVQAQTTLVDGLLTVVTIGIYSPRSVRVWCK